jgi:tetratricopeptide (TPR) repeat protein
MAIEGPLRELALTDVLQLLSLSKKTGELHVRRDGEQHDAIVYLADGAVVGVRGSGRTRRLGELLLLSGKVTERQIQAAVEEQRVTPGVPLGSILVATHGVSPEEVRRQLKFQVEELVFDLARWVDGYFRFEEGPPLARDLPIRLTADSLLLEAARRMDELAAMQHQHQHADPVPTLGELSPGGAPLDLEPLHWEILAAIDGERDLGEIAREVGRSELDVARAVFSLVSDGVVALANRRVTVEPAPRGDSLAAIRQAIASERIAEAEALLEPLLAEGGSGEAFYLAAHLESARGRWGPALGHLEEAVARDPLLEAAQTALGVAAVRVGRLERAEEALRTSLRLLDGDSPRRAGVERLERTVGQLRAALREVES